MKKIILSIVTLIAIIGLTPIFPNTAYAACPSSSTPKGQVIDGIKEAGDTCSGTGVTTFLSTVVNILSLVVGIAAVIVVILSGFKYIASGGDSGKVASAKNTLIYALIGVAIAALAQFLVHFALATSNDSVTPPSTSKSKTP